MGVIFAAPLNAVDMTFGPPGRSLWVKMVRAPRSLLGEGVAIEPFWSLPWVKVVGVPRSSLGEGVAIEPFWSLP